MSTIRLNTDQERAVSALDGRVLVTAGAGSGKTRVLTERAVRAVSPGAPEQWKPVDISQVLAITFTEKAAGELGERIRATLRASGQALQARRVDAAWISTIHGMCSRIVRAEALAAGVDPAFRVLDAVEAGRLQQLSLEHAVRRSLEHHDELGVIGVYGYSAVASTVCELERALRVVGAGAHDLGVPTPQRAADLAEQARAFFCDKAQYFSSCGLDTRSVSEHHTACNETFLALSELGQAGLPDNELAEMTWRALMEYRTPRTSAGVSEHKAQIKEERLRLCAHLAHAITAPLARELVELTDAYAERFASLKRASSSLDFDDLQVVARNLLADSEVAARWGERFALVMVDEFQDTDALQLSLVESLGRRSLCTVGDTQQSIYRFRGADVEVYRAHREEMRSQGATCVTLAANYRSHPAVLAFVNELFSAEGLLGEELVRLKPGREEPSPPVLPDGTPRVEALVAPLEGNRGESAARAQLATAVAQRIAELREHHGVRVSDVAILLPYYTHAHVYADALAAAGIEAVIVGGSRFFGQREVAMVRAALRTVINGDDEPAVAALLASDFCGLSDQGLLAVRRHARAGETTLWAAAAESPLSQDDRGRVEVLVRTVVQARARLGEAPLAETILGLVEGCGLDLRMLAGGVSGAQAYATVLKLARMATAFEASGEAGPAAFLAYLDAKEELGDHEAPAVLADDGTPAVRIMSVHAAKGLEFPVVFAVELSASGNADRRIARWDARPGGELTLALPAGWAAEAASRRPLRYAELEESARAAEVGERKRLFYVACTRARELLVLTGTRTTGSSTSQTMTNWLLDTFEVPVVPDTLVSRRCEGSSDVSFRILPMAGGKSVDQTLEPAGDGPVPLVGRENNDEWFELLSVDAVQPARPPEAVRRLSYSGVQLFQRCPLRFRAEKVLGLGTVAGSGLAAQRGSALHTLMQVVGEDGKMESARAEAIARFHGLGDADARLLEGAASAYRNSAIADEVRAAHSVRREVAFALQVGDARTGFILDGTIDVYARTDGEALIVDYKSGSALLDRASFAERVRLQAGCYALAAVRDGATRVRAVFVRPEVLVDAQPDNVHFSFTAEDARGVEKMLAGVHAQMQDGGWEHRAQWDEATCGDCPAFSVVCPLPRPSRRGDG